MGEIVPTAIVIALVAAFLAVLIRVTYAAHLKHQQQFVDQYNQRHPPITDEEFILRCSPSVTPEVAIKVRRTMSDALGIDYDRIYPETNIINPNRT